MLGGDDVRIIYRHYATLFFVFVVEETESELGILDLIQVSHSSRVIVDAFTGLCGELRSFVSECL